MKEVSNINNKQTGPFHHGMGHKLTNRGNIMKHQISLFAITGILYYFLFPLCIDMYSASMEMGNAYIIAFIAIFNVLILSASTVPAIIAIIEIMETNNMEEKS